VAESEPRLESLFPLGALAGPLAGYAPPRGEFDPSGSWKATFGIHTLAFTGKKPVGRLTIEREAKGNGGVSLSVRTERTVCGGATVRVQGQTDCAGDVLATPRSWRFSSVTVLSNGKPVASTRIEKRAELRDGVLRIEDARSRREIPAPGPCALGWALFDVVQRLPRGGGSPLEFGLIDHFDQLKPEQRLAHWKTARAAVGGKPQMIFEYENLERGRIGRAVQGYAGAETVTLDAFSVVGRGNVPWVYWVDERGRLLFVAAGIEGYVRIEE